MNFKQYIILGHTTTIISSVFCGYRILTLDITNSAQNIIYFLDVMLWTLGVSALTTYKMNLQNVHFQFTPREANKVVHALAQLALNLESSF